MLQSLLAERYKLAVYLLTVGKDGSKLKPALPDAATSKWEPAPGHILLLRIFVDEGWMVFSKLNGVSMLEANDLDLTVFSRFLGLELETPVLDRTGLSGSYEIPLAVPCAFIRRVFHSTADSGEQASDPSGVDLFKSVEKLGLHLEKAKP